MRRSAPLAAFFLALLAACASADDHPPVIVVAADPPGGAGGAGGAIGALGGAAGSSPAGAGGGAAGGGAGGSESDAGTDAPPGDASASEGGPPTDGGSDAGPSDGCTVFGAPGQCVLVAACASLGAHTSYTGHCSGPPEIECCIVTPNVANTPPVPAGWMPMKQAQVTPAMTTWAVMILDDPAQYPMFATTMMTFGALLVVARVEWHPPDFQNGVIHRGVTLYVHN